jgi:hypothetical protein
MVSSTDLFARAVDDDDDGLAPFPLAGRIGGDPSMIFVSAPIARACDVAVRVMSTPPCTVHVVVGLTDVSPPVRVRYLPQQNKHQAKRNQGSVSRKCHPS